MQLPDYLEFTVSDMAAGKAFYETAFGVAFTDYGPEYAGANTESFEIGLTTLGDGPKPPLPGFQTDDIAAALETVRGAGGTIVQEIYEFPGGRRFHFTDPAGNEALVYQYEVEA